MYVLIFRIYKTKVIIVYAVYEKKKIGSGLWKITS